MPMSTLLELDRITSGYGRLPVLREVSLTVGAGEIAHPSGRSWGTCGGWNATRERRARLKSKALLNRLQRSGREIEAALGANSTADASSEIRADS